MNIRNLKLSSDEEEKEDCARARDMKSFSRNGGLGLICSAEYQGHDARVTDWGGRQEKAGQMIEALEQIVEFKEAYMTAGTKLVTMTGVVPEITWRACNAN